MKNVIKVIVIFFLLIVVLCLVFSLVSFANRLKKEVSGNKNIEKITDNSEQIGDNSGQIDGNNTKSTDNQFVNTIYDYNFGKYNFGYALTEDGTVFYQRIKSEPLYCKDDPNLNYCKDVCSDRWFVSTRAAFIDLTGCPVTKWYDYYSIDEGLTWQRFSSEVYNESIGNINFRMFDSNGEQIYQDRDKDILVGIYKSEKSVNPAIDLNIIFNSVFLPNEVRGSYIEEITHLGSFSHSSHVYYSFLNFGFMIHHEGK